MDRVIYNTENDKDEAIPVNPDHKEHVSNYYKILGERIKKAREERGFTLSKLATYVGLTAAAVANYESGIRQLPVHLLLDFAQFLGKPIQFFIGPNFNEPLMLANIIKSEIQRFTDASYIPVWNEIVDGKLRSLPEPYSMIPAPQDISKGYHFAVQQSSPITGTLTYYVCQAYLHRRKNNPNFQKNISVLPFVVEVDSGNIDIDSFPGAREFIKGLVKRVTTIEPDDWVISLIGDTFELELVQFKNITASSVEYEGTDSKTINVNAVVIAKIERLVK